MIKTYTLLSAIDGGKSRTSESTGEAFGRKISLHKARQTSIFSGLEREGHGECFATQRAASGGRSPEMAVWVCRRREKLRGKREKGRERERGIVKIEE